MAALVGIIFAIAFFVVFAWIARRLLGVRRLSVTKTVIAAAVGIGAGLVIERLLEVRGGFDRDLATVAGVVLGLIATMVTILLFEATSNPERASRRSGIPRPYRAVRRGIDRTQRSIELTRIASRHGLSKGFGLATGGTMTPSEAAAYGADLRAAFEEAGPVFVKLGQLLATRPDLIPAETADELAQLHQDVEPAPRSAVEPALEASLGQRIDEVFAEFDWSPIGAASIGQVYRARLVSGEPVVVKARRPDVAEVVDRDLGLALQLADLVEQSSEQAQKLGVKSVADQFAAQLRDEMDYTIEARNTVEVSMALDPTGSISVPEVFAAYSSDAVLVQEWIEGETLGRHGVVGGERGRRLADELFEFEVGAMLDGGRFHADPHPGNVMIRTDGTLALIDFGSAGRLDTFERAAVTDILTALALNDPSLLREAALRVGMEGDEVDPGQLDRAFARLMADHLGPGAEPSAELLADFLMIVNKFGLRMPTGVSEMLRALATLQGSLERLSPGYPIIDAAQGVAMGQLEAELTPDNLAEEVKRETIRLAPLLRRAPVQLDRIAGQIEQGRLNVRVSLFSNETDVRVVSRLVNRAVLAFIGAALGIVSAMLFQIGEGPALSDNVGLFDLLAFIGLFSGAILIMRVVLEVLRER